MSNEDNFGNTKDKIMKTKIEEKQDILKTAIEENILRTKIEDQKNMLKTDIEENIMKIEAAGPLIGEIQEHVIGETRQEWKGRKQYEKSRREMQH